ncbi:hypothetical protein Tco_0944858 [Tanacetum coccineum]
MEVLIKTCLMPLAIKTQNDSFTFVHELKQEMHADLKYVESLKNEIDELKSDKAEFSNMYDILLQECVSNDVMCSYLHSLSDLDAHSELQCLYLHKVKECECLAQKLSKQTESINLKAQLQDKNIAISELKKLIEKCKGKSVETKFDKPSVVRQPNAQRIPKPSVLGKLAPFLDSLERKSFSQTKSVPKTNLLESLSKLVTTRIFASNSKASNITINRVYYVEGLNQNLFLVGQFCDADLEVALWKSTCFVRGSCFVRDLQGNDLLAGNRGSDLYTISLQETTLSTPICLMVKASPTQAWLWH